MTTKKYFLIHSRQYKKDYRKIERSGRYDLRKLDAVLKMLQAGEVLPSHMRNHRLHGGMQHCEECHIEGDWLLIYERKEEFLILVAQRTGTHSDLFGM